ncbi:MAG: pitrilysin family protein [Bacteroidota bacterium]
MITYDRFVLDNGLRVIVHEDRSTPMVAVNVLYDVGSRDESPDRTGFAHLFEHLMFGGSANVPEFDEPLQLAGGENNAFTNSDVTNFYNLLPAQNIETAFWLESDRMLSLNFDEEVLETQRKVVVEEFKETCLNQPYGDAWHHLSEMVFQSHPYRWPTIGKTMQHVEEANMDDVKSFYFKYYRPNNAILVVSGNTDATSVKVLAEKWFGDIPNGAIPKRELPQEADQHEERGVEICSDVPLNAIYMAFQMFDRLHSDYYVADLLSDILCNGRSSRLYQRLLKQKQLFSQIDCYVSGSIDKGVLVVEGRPAEKVDMVTAEAAIWAELDQLVAEGVEEQELQKVKNRVESTLVFSEMSILNKAINLAFFEVLGDVDRINQEASIYQKITTTDIQRVAKQLLRKDNCSTLRYRSNSSIEPTAVTELETVF